ncbi:ribosomal-protein-alanine N-acetyltransferase [Rhizobium sp. SG_E_25_P2]|jgi:[ribosomal protein S18]-alanine N-acetyltransferase|uniref:N-acetyltransferase n=1 Tax=Rhizobium sp. SG_E_25_P2 TaxID=2879942 RepID=UPI0024736DE9|nr:N-acetyltransferase [Rhizobium sp. SG_E_25_P2]MDH6265051.1 ribosomal-protein-alanine N-acetyltransferase [Rhizobium sp. SG_E_25_P2]
MKPGAFLENLFVRKIEFDIFPAENSDCDEFSRLHGERFYRRWGDGEFHSLMTQDTVFGFSARVTSGPSLGLGGFVLARAAAGEAEILTIAVSDKFGRQGLGWRLMLAAMRETRARGGETIFLEVDEGNVSALGLYRKLGFRQVAERKGYYADGDGGRSTALVMRLDLR